MDRRGCRGLHYDGNEKQWQGTRKWGKEGDHIRSQSPQRTVALYKMIKKNKNKKQKKI
jgi:hypothetical protein